MRKEEFRETKVGGQVIIGGNSKFKGQIVTIIKKLPESVISRCAIVHNEIIGERKYHYGILQSINQELKESNKSNEIEKRDRSLEFKFIGSKEDVEIMIKEVKKIVKDIAPKAKLVIKKGENKNE